LICSCGMSGDFIVIEGTFFSKLKLLKLES